MKSIWEAENPGKDSNKTQFTFMNSIMKQKYQEETKDVQNSVRKCREELKAGTDADREDKSTVYQK